MTQTVTVLFTDTDSRPFLLGAGGCFWGVELAFQRVPGVTKTSVGYTAGHDKAPTYNSVCSGQTGHTEAVQVRVEGLGNIGLGMTCYASLCNALRNACFGCAH